MTHIKFQTARHCHLKDFGLTSLLFLPKDGNSAQSQMWLGSFNSAKKNKKTSSSAFLTRAKTKQNGDLYVCVCMTRLTCCRVHTGSSLCGNCLCTHTKCFSPVYLWTLCKHIKYNATHKYGIKYIYKLRILAWFLILSDGKLTFLCYFFLLSTTFTSATLVVDRVEGKFVITLLTATNSVLLNFTFGDQFLISWWHKK